jgi:spermidine synthase
MFLAGCNLSLIHYVSLNELPAMLGSNELVALIVLAAYFLGLSGGYLISDKLSRRQLLGVGAATLGLHLTLPFSARWVAGTMWRINLQGLTPPFLFFLVLLGITPFYAVFLPRLVDAADAAGPGDPGKGGRLVPLYATELLGSVTGLLVSALLTPARFGVILALHLAGIVGLLALSAPERRRLLGWLVAPLALGYLALFSTLDRQSLEYFYKHRRGFREVNLLASELSPYQRVDIFEATTKQGKSRYLYLNGNLFYGDATLHQHNLAVSILPNLLVGRPSNALVIAGGSLDAARFLAPRVDHLRVVELDEAVVRLAREHLQEPRGGFPTNWELIIDDGKHFLGAWEGKPFDVISIDVPVPTHLQTAMLHSARFFALARTRLAPGGIFSISLSGIYRAHDPADDTFVSHIAQRVMAGLYASFPHVTVVEVDERAFAWASDAPLPLSAGKIREKMNELLRSPDARDFGVPDIQVLDDADARYRAAGFAPIGEADMQMVLRLSINKLYDRFYEPSADR